MCEYLILDLFYVALWFILYLIRRDLRKEMIFASLLCAPLALTDAIFIPRYWKPSVLVKLTFLNLSFNIESFIFCFAVGGIAAVLYEVVLKKHLKKVRGKRIETKRHFYTLAGVMIFSVILFSFIFKSDFMYTAIITLALGAISIMFSRKDIIKEIIIGGILFLIVYCGLLFIFNTFVIPDYIARTWSFENFWGITFLKFPLEEILWALTFGLLWAPIYETLKGYTLK